jgi:hypothetical protein
MFHMHMDRRFFCFKLLGFCIGRGNIKVSELEFCVALPGFSLLCV